MSKKSTFGKNLLSNKLPIAICYLLATSAFAQTQQEMATILSKNKNRIFSKSANASTLMRKSATTISTLKKQAEKLKIPYEGVTEKGGIFTLQGFDEAGRPIYYSTLNAGAASTMGITELQSSTGKFNLQGEGMNLFEWDGGIAMLTHDELKGRAFQGEGDTGTTDNHATHVAGTMIAAGVNESAKGMAPKAKLYSYNWSGDLNEALLAIQGQTNGKVIPLVSNHSYGRTAGFTWGNYSGNTGWHWMGDRNEEEDSYFGKYGSTDAAWDLIQSVAPYYLHIRAAGNSRLQGPGDGVTYYYRELVGSNYLWSETNTTEEFKHKNGGKKGGYDIIPSGSLGKNTLTVGAASKIPNGYKASSDVVLGSFSSTGPTDDGRIKPDITGVGVQVWSSVPGNNGKSLYESQSGTSMAAPSVTGSLILLQEHYNKLYKTDKEPYMRAATLKGLAIHTANEAGKYDGPDYEFGWGLFNGVKAAETISLKDKYSLIQEKTLANKGTYSLDVVASGDEPLKVTLSWSDPAQASEKLSKGEVVDDSAIQLINDLDIRVYDESGVEYKPWILDPTNPSKGATKGDNIRDNVEQVEIKNAVAGKKYTIKVTHKDSLRKNKAEDVGKIFLEASDDQDFSLIATGINNNVTKDAAVNSITLPSAISFASDSQVSVEVENKMAEVLSGAKLKVTLFNVKENRAEGTEQVIALEDIPAKGKVTKQVTLDLSKTLTDYKVIAKVEADGDSVEFNNEVAVAAFGIVADVTTEDKVYQFSFEESFAKHGWESRDFDKDGNTWKKYDLDRLAKTGNSFAVNEAYKTEVAEGQMGSRDLLFSNPLKLKGGQAYQVIFNVRKFTNDFKEVLDVYLFNSDKRNPIQIGDQIVAEEDKMYRTYSYEVTPATDGIYYLGFSNNAGIGVANYAIALDDVKVKFAKGTAEADFRASSTTPNTYETVELKNNTIYPSTEPASYKWTFSPSDVKFQNRTTDTSETPKVVFPQAVPYTIKLTATNASGSVVAEKTNYVTPANTAIKATFDYSVDALYEGETLSLTSTTQGNPAASEYEWRITPEEGVKFEVNPDNIFGLDDDKKFPTAKVKFSKGGVYEVRLWAKSQHNESLSEPVKIEVLGIYNPVTNLENKAKLPAVNLTWVRPEMNTTYAEGFNGESYPSDVKYIDNNRDGWTWMHGGVVYDNPNGSGGQLMEKMTFSQSRKAAGITKTDDYLISPKLRKGAELLEFNSYHRQAERFDAYIVPAPSTNKTPTVAEIQAGHKVFTFDAVAEETNTKIHHRSVNIKDKTTSDFYVVFHHRNTEADSGYALGLDEIKVGYVNASTSANKSAGSVEAPTTLTAETGTMNDLRRDVDKNIVFYETSEKVKEMNQNMAVIYGVSKVPYLVGYEVYKDNVRLGNITNIDQLSQVDTLTKLGTYVYDVYAKYSDGVKSEKQTISVAYTKLGTGETAVSSKLVVYEQNKGNFVVKEGTGKSVNGIEVYDATGKLVSKKSYNANEVVVDLSSQAQGVYLLNVISADGEKHSVKVIVR